jgi:hypothetical protein
MLYAVNAHMSVFSKTVRKRINCSHIYRINHLWMKNREDKVSEFSIYYFFIITLSGVRLSPLGTAATNGLLYQPQMTDDGDCRATDGTKFGR